MGPKNENTHSSLDKIWHLQMVYRFQIFKGFLSFFLKKVSFLDFFRFESGFLKGGSVVFWVLIWVTWVSIASFLIRNVLEG